MFYVFIICEMFDYYIRQINVFVVQTNELSNLPIVISGMKFIILILKYLVEISHIFGDYEVFSNFFVRGTKSRAALYITKYILIW